MFGLKNFWERCKKTTGPNGDNFDLEKVNQLSSREEWQAILEYLDILEFWDPDNLNHKYYYQGLAHAKMGQNQSALEFLEKLAVTKPDYPGLKFASANVMLALGRNREAIVQYKAALTEDGLLVPAWINLGRAYFETGDTTLAVRVLNRAIDLDRSNLTARIYLSRIYRKEKSYSDAEKTLKPGLKDVPTIDSGLLLDAMKELVDVYVAQGKHEQALDLVDQLIKIRTGNFSQSENAELYGVKGYVLQTLGNVKAAEEHYTRSIQMDNSIVQTHCNIGLLKLDLGLWEEAKASFLAARQIDPLHIPTNWQLSLFELSEGKFSKGWIDYDLRFFNEKGMQREFSLPIWEGARLKEGELLVTAEQGLGDEIMFASCIPDLMQVVPSFVLECHPKLERIYSRSFPALEVVGREQSLGNDWIYKHPNLKQRIAVGSLPKFFRCHCKDFPGEPYLIADATKVGIWRKRLEYLGTGLKVGISWRGGIDRTRKNIRSIPLSEWAPLLEKKEVHFVNLQYTDCQQEIYEAETKLGISINNWQEAIDDYEETIALVKALDLVITVQTALVHLTGAVGTKAFVLISSSPEWRYMSSGDCMPWYSNLTLIRQKKLFVWKDVIDTVSGKIDSLIGQQFT